MKGKCTLAAAIIAALGVSCSMRTDRSQVKYTDTNVIAVVLGKKITTEDKEELDGIIFGALLERYANENKIQATRMELDQFVEKTETKAKELQAEWLRDRAALRTELKSSALSDRERKEKESRLQTIEHILKSTRDVENETKGMEKQRRSSERTVAQHFVRTWKINKALYVQYGGRVIFQQAGVEPVDAYRDFLKDEEKKGSFQILDRRYEASFWRYFTNDTMHTFYSKDEGARFINTPWWMMEEASAD